MHATCFAMRIARLLTGGVFLIGSAACHQVVVDRADLSCDAGQCASGYVCHPLQNLCVPALQVDCAVAEALCPTSVSAGDSCPSVGSFISCTSDTTGCEHGCRTCQDDLTWSGCPVETLAHVAQVDCVTDGAAASCNIAACEAGYVDLDQVTTTGCEYACTPTGAVEVCDAADVDEDCNGLVDDADPAATGKGSYSRDLDGDGHGAGAASLYCDPPAGWVANSTDCDDGNDHCALDCTDADGDGYCADQDCNDAAPACTTSCAACPPTLPVTLTLTSDGPRTACTSATLTLDLGGYTGASAELSCSAPDVVFDQATFATGDDSWTVNNTDLRTWPNFFPASCPSSGQFERFSSSAYRYLQLGAAIDARGYKNLGVSFLVGYRDTPPSWQALSLSYCCGVGCTANQPVATVPNAAGGGSDGCRVESFTLPAAADDCAALMLRFALPNGTGAAGIDDLDVTGEPAFGPPSESGGGLYASTLRSCLAATIDATCTWDDGVHAPLTDSTSVVFQ